MRRVDSLEKTPDAGKEWGQEEKGLTEDASQWPWVCVDSGLLACEMSAIVQ